MAYPVRYKRMVVFAVCALLFAAGSWMILSALEQNTQFFYNASDVAENGFQPESKQFRVGGIVVAGSVKTSGITTTFDVTDFERPMLSNLKVTYSGALPDLFREGQGVVVSGQLIGPLEINASEVLAKHDENYQPKINYENEK